MEIKDCLKLLQTRAPKVHCLTNPVSMQDMANILLAAGGSAIMAQEPAEAAEITVFCQATLLNTGVPDEKKFQACAAAGIRAAELGHPVILDPVGVGASGFRKEQMARLLERVRPSLIRCNPEEAYTLLGIAERMRQGAEQDDADREGKLPSPVLSCENMPSGGVESKIFPGPVERQQVAIRLARAFACTVLISGEADAVSDGWETTILTGGDRRIARITGSGCMLSALCALFAGAGCTPRDAALTAGKIWKRSAYLAGVRADRAEEGIGSFHRYLFDALEQICREGWI